MVDISNTRGNTTQENLLTLKIYMGPLRIRHELYFSLYFFYTRQRTEEQCTFCIQKKISILCFPEQMITERLICFFCPTTAACSKAQAGQMLSHVCRKRSHYFPFWKFDHTRTFSILVISNNLNWPENKTQSFISNITRSCSHLKCFYLI